MRSLADVSPCHRRRCFTAETMTGEGRHSLSMVGLGCLKEAIGNDYSLDGLLWQAQIGTVHFTILAIRQKAHATAPEGVVGRRVTMP